MASDTRREDGAQVNELKRGWPIMLACLLGTMTSVIALPFYIIGPITPMLEAEFAWDRTSIVAATAFMQLGLVFGMPLSGKAIDRFGGGRTALVSYGMVVLVFCALAVGLESLSQLQIAYLLLGLLCAGASTVPFTLLIGKWFTKKRGLALGVALAGTGFASFFAPHIADIAGSAFGWRAVLFVVAGFIAIGIPVVLIGYRDPPAEVSQGRVSHALFEDDHVQATWRQLVVDPRFVLLGAILIMGGFFISSMVVHFVPMLIDEGLEPASAARIASLNGLAMIFGRLIIGWLLDRFPAVLLGTGMFLIAAAGCLAFAAGGAQLASITVIAMGFMIGAEIDLLSYLVLRYFRIGDYGLVYGYLYGIFMPGCIASPWIVGYFIDTGGYALMFKAAAAMFTFIAALFPVLERLKPGPVGIAPQAKVAL